MKACNLGSFNGGFGGHISEVASLGDLFHGDEPGDDRVVLSSSSLFPVLLLVFDDEAVGGEAMFSTLPRVESSSVVSS